MKILPAQLLLCLFLLLSFSNISAAALDLSKEEQEWLNNNGSIRISGPQAFPPFQYIDTDGSFKGMASDYIFHIAKMVGLKVIITEKQPWPEVLKKIENKEIDLLTCAAFTDERSRYLSYSKPHLSFPLIIITKNNAPFIDGLQGLQKKTIAVSKKSSIIDWLKRDHIDVSFLLVDSPLKALKAVSLGKADAAIENLAAATYLIEKNGLSNLKVAAPTPYEDYSLSIAIRKDWPELTNIINKALLSMTPEEHSTIRNRWISVQYEKGLINIKTISKWITWSAIAVIFIVTLFYLWNRMLAREIRMREKVERENQILIDDLRTALSEIKTLRGIIPICSHCKKIRDEKGVWSKIELYIRNHSEAEFSHGICLECANKHYPDLTKDDPQQSPTV